MKQLVETTPSTNTLLENMISNGSLDCTDAENDLFTLHTFRQTAGRGQKGNSWESEPDKNLTFSTLFQIQQIPVEKQFLLSEMVPLAITNVLRRLLSKSEKQPEGIRIKWPNDIYFDNRKICGILIEHSIIDNKIDHSIAGIGININQTTFRSDAPNPVSLKQITHTDYDLNSVLDDVIKEFELLKPMLQQPEKLKAEYMSRLYRAEGYFPYAGNGKRFEACIEDIADNGMIIMKDRQGNRLQFAFKQLTYLIEF